MINEDGTELLYLPGCSYLEVKNTLTSGYKLLAYIYDYSIVNWTVNTQVYGLPGSLPSNGVSESGPATLRMPYPNPAGDIVTIPYELPAGVEQAGLELLDSSGRVLKHYTVDRNFHDLQIMIADLPQGAYLYRLRSDHGTFGTGTLLHH